MKIIDAVAPDWVAADIVDLAHMLAGRAEARRGFGDDNGADGDEAILFTVRALLRFRIAGEWRDNDDA